MLHTFEWLSYNFLNHLPLQTTRGNTISLSQKKKKKEIYQPQEIEWKTNIYVND